MYAGTRTRTYAKVVRRTRGDKYIIHPDSCSFESECSRSQMNLMCLRAFEDECPKPNASSTKHQRWWNRYTLLVLLYCIKRERSSGERRAAYEWRYGYAGATVSSSCQLSRSAVTSQESTNSGGKGGEVEEVEEANGPRGKAERTSAATRRDCTPLGWAVESCPSPRRTRSECSQCLRSNNKTWLWYFDEWRGWRSYNAHTHYQR